MICHLCEQYQVETLRFNTLFVYKPFCLTCEKKYFPRFYQEIIPCEYDEILYNFVYQESMPSIRHNRLLFRHMKVYFRLIDAGNYEEGIKIIIDFIEMRNFQDWFPFIKGMGKVYFFSLFYYDLTVFAELF